MQLHARVTRQQFWCGFDTPYLMITGFCSDVLYFVFNHICNSITALQMLYNVIEWLDIIVGNA